MSALMDMEMRILCECPELESKKNKKKGKDACHTGIHFRTLKVLVRMQIARRQGEVQANNEQK